ncbi:MAG TPA: fibronectin type III domain-containing protein [Spirochaetales bacterium]|nr:fibronectin type III domain-containing protein [Spirochaetales bacterium]
MRRRWVCIGLALLLVLTGCNIKPKAPTITLTTPTEGQKIVVAESAKVVTLAWSAADPNNKPLSFDVFVGESVAGMTKRTTTTATTYQVTGLTPGKTYYWKVTASNGKESTASEVSSFVLGGQLSTVKVIEFNTGAMVAGVTVKIEQGNNVLLTGTTDAMGHFKSYLFDEVYTVRVTGTDRATSLVTNYRPVRIPVIEMASNVAQTDYDQIPTLTVTLQDSLDHEIASGDVIVEKSIKVTINSDELMDVLYLGLGFVPAATVRTAAAFNVHEAVFTVSLDGQDGKTIPLHIVAYTPNRTRLDQIVYLPIDYTAGTVTPIKAPESPWVYGWTSDADVEYYSITEKLSKALSGRISSNKMKELKANLAKAPTPEHIATGINMLAYISWDSPSGVTGLAGYNVYRKIEGGDYEKICYTTLNYCYDKGFDLNPGSTYYYKITAVYSDGQESPGAETEEVVPLDIWKVKMISPADNATGVSRTPTFTWKPVVSATNSGTPHIGGPSLDDSEILYVFYGPWIYDQAVSDQHIFNHYYFETQGPVQQSVAFLGGPGSWIRIYPDGSYDYQTESLEKMKTYEWGLDLASAVAWTGATGSNMWFSTTIDLGYGLDYWDNPADAYNRFTTGN